MFVRMEDDLVLPAMEFRSPTPPNPLGCFSPPPPALPQFRYRSPSPTSANYNAGYLFRQRMVLQERQEQQAILLSTRCVFLALLNMNRLADDNMSPANFSIFLRRATRRSIMRERERLRSEGFHNISPSYMLCIIHYMFTIKTTTPLSFGYLDLCMWP